MLLRSDGRTHSLVTNTPAAEGAPRWSPDGSRLVYGRGGEVFVMFADGSGAHAVARGDSPVWVEDAPLGPQLLDNGSFEAELRSWHYDDQRGPADPRPRIADRDGRRTALRLDTLDLRNEHYAYRQSVALAGVDYPSLELSWWWRVDAIEAPYGQASVQLAFYAPGAVAATAVGEVRRTGGDPQACCDAPGANAWGLCRCVDDVMPEGQWRFERVAMRDVLERAGLTSGDLERVEVVVDSYKSCRCATPTRT